MFLTFLTTKNIGTELFISALLALAVFVAPVAAAGTSFSQLTSFSCLNGFSGGTDNLPIIPDASGGVPSDIIDDDPVGTRLFSSSTHNLGTFVIKPFIPDKTTAEFARTVGPRYGGYYGC